MQVHMRIYAYTDRTRVVEDSAMLEGPRENSKGEKKDSKVSINTTKSIAQEEADRGLGVDMERARINVPVRTCSQ